jgi:hypothetical protein
MGYHRELEAAVETMKALRRRGVRILPGGDYGFAWTPHGTNAKDLEYFVKFVGMSPMEALLSATAWGAPMMKMKDAIGQVKEGFLADLLLVDGDPLADITVLQDRDRLLAVMKDGEFHRAPPVRAGRAPTRWAAYSAAKNADAGTRQQRTTDSRQGPIHDRSFPIPQPASGDASVGAAQADADAPQGNQYQRFSPPAQ